MTEKFNVKTRWPLILGISATLFLSGCPEDDDNGEGGYYDDGYYEYYDEPRCGEMLKKVDLEAVLGIETTWDESEYPPCSFSAGEGSGGVQVFGDGQTTYDQMKMGTESIAKPNSLSDGSVGASSFEYQGDMLGYKEVVEIGFLDSSSRYAVLVYLNEPIDDLENARILADMVNAKLTDY